jgi:hypothetical protein
MASLPIWICLVTKENQATVRRSILSAARVCHRFRHRDVHLLVLVKSIGDGLKDWLVQHWPNRFIYQGRAEVLDRDHRHRFLYQQTGLDLERDSVHRARIQLMLATMELGEELDGILWQIDDDMCFLEAGWDGHRVTIGNARDYFSEVRAYAVNYPGVHAVIGRCTNAPPLPALLYMRHQLMDLASRRIPTPVLSTDGQAYHDLYSMESRADVAQALACRSLTLPLVQLMSGEALTRPIVSGPEDFMALGPRGSILRGGNFIIFDRRVAEACIHPGFRFAGRTARRSDMAHQWLLQRIGFDIRPAQISLFHDRRYEAPDPSRLVGDYLDDVLGSVAIRSLESMEAAQERLMAHEEHLQDLVAILEHHGAQSLALAVADGLAELRTWEAASLESALEEYRNRMFEQAKHIPHEASSGRDRSE